MALTWNEDETTNNGASDWQLLLAYIGAKRTHEPAFQKLFQRMLSEEDERFGSHPYQRQARALNALYDFTPLRSVEE